MDIHTHKKNQDDLERVHERNFENCKLMRQILGKILCMKFSYMKF